MGEVPMAAGAAAHAARMAPYVEPHLARRQQHLKHPVHDFLFTYYSYRPNQLLTWKRPGALTEQQRPLAQATLRLLRATANRPGSFGCFGLHEWAMVYRQPETRHPQPLRLGPAETDRVVEGHRIACSHWDAVRFFTPPALPLNTLTPGKADRPDFEQPACLHATMDLYKHAYRLADAVGSEVIADAFELAWEVRNVDMRAAPYDLTGITFDPDGVAWTPLPIETPEGKREYAELQRGFAERAAPIRQRLIDRLAYLLDGTTEHDTTGEPEEPAVTRSA